MLNIASERKKLGLTQAALAEKIGVVESTVRAWELGSRDPNASSIRLMSAVFCCTADYLIGLTEERLPH